MEDLFDDIDVREHKKKEIVYKDIHIEGEKKVNGDRGKKTSRRNNGLRNVTPEFLPKMYYRKDEDGAHDIRVGLSDFSESTIEKYKLNQQMFNRYYKPLRIERSY